MADALATLDPRGAGGVRLVYTAHSVPDGMATASGSHTATWVDGREARRWRQDGGAAIPGSSGKFASSL